MPSRIAIRIATLCALIGLSCSVHAAEPWADESLPVKAGLELWLDAARENLARGSPGAGQGSDLARIPNDGPVDVWHDGSGKRRHFQQFANEARPHLIQGIQGATMRFDGNNDFLIATAAALELTQFTVFIQAAPRSNQGGFRAFLGASRAGHNDYTSGLNVDQGFGSSSRFEVLNVEGAGCGGFRDLLKSDFAFEQSHVLTLTANAHNGITLWTDGMPQESRPRSATPIALDLFTIGARLFSNTTEPAHVQGFFEGDISRVLIYGRALGDEERLLVEQYLQAQTFSKNLPGRKPVAIHSISNPPAVRMFLPGFAWRELPVPLKNINCVKYREDGKLVALGYDGRIWLLSDTNGDGVEDMAASFWQQDPLRAPIGMALTPRNYPHGQGVFVPSKGKLSLIVDTNHDDVADQELVIAKGWNELPHGVDALGAAVDPQGNIYFGLGTANFTDPYLLNAATARSTYSLESERGTILRVSADFEKREIICTGIRFPVALAFNAQGDLFCTDQEGATWLPNGNPLDELLHIEKGRHYGFPPRHPKYLAGVIDEPSLFDYGPQHQSTCGLNFNEPVNGGPTFGPPAWHGDALVTGYSRGKLYRTKLVKTARGYIACNQLIGSVDGLPADACVSPQGALVIAVHSGAPDWGSGPTGAGKLYKVFYSKSDQARPIAVWPASETQTLVEFDRPLQPAELKDQQITITEGRYVGAGDRFEMRRPGYQAIANQLAEPRYALEVLSTALAADGRTLAIRTASRNSAVSYAVSLPVPGAKTGTNLADSVELAYDLTGVGATWQSTSQPIVKSAVWLPHLDLTVARQFTSDTRTHENFWQALKQSGHLNLRTQLDLWHMLRPDIQPGSQLDFVYTKETVTLVLQSHSKFTATAPGANLERLGDDTVQLTFECETNRWFPLEVVLELAGGTDPDLNISWFTAEDKRRRALPLRRFYMPWATPDAVGPAPERSIPELVGGNWLLGRKLFHGEKAACGKCHRVGGQGGKIGPDLSNLLHRDYASVLQDIQQPSAALNPDHLAYNLELKPDGDVTSGVLVGGDDSMVLLADASGRSTSIPRNHIRSMKASTISLMPEGLLEGLSESQRKDLLSFLLLPEPLEAAAIEIPGAPIPRKRSELERTLAAALAPSGGATTPMRVILCAGPKDHGPGEHDYPLWQKRWSKLLALAENVAVQNAAEWPSTKQFNEADVVVFYSDNPGWSPDRAQELDRFLNRGGGLVYIHYAVDGHGHCEALAERIGLAWRGGASMFRHGPVDLRFNVHPITSNFENLHLVDETYWKLVGNQKDIEILSSAKEDGISQPLMWVREQGKGRVFVSIPGHYTWTFDDPLFRILLFRGMAWTARQPLNRFDELATVGARLSE